PSTGCWRCRPGGSTSFYRRWAYHVRASLTATGERLARPTYMAPQQCDRDGRLDRPWDLQRSEGFDITILVQVVLRRTRLTVLPSEARANEPRDHHPARDPGRRAAACGLGRRRLQRAGGRPDPLRERLLPDRRATQAPLRPDPEPDRMRQGLHGSRAGDA